MARRVVQIVILTGLFGLLLPDGTNAGGKAGGHHAAHFDKCAKACTTCMRECESCAHHCAHLIAQGQKEHLKTLGTCADCADFCTAAARIVSRGGSMAGTICESCAKACDICGKACEDLPNDEHMQRCAKACRDCARECREMIQHLSQDQAK
jgi:uncharacterized protein Yka (UPF0111/DUF47 family)